MIQVRTSSLQSGTSVYTLLKSHPLVKQSVFVPLVDPQGRTLGWINKASNGIVLKKCHSLSYGKINNVKCFSFKKNTDLTSSLAILERELEKMGLLSHPSIPIPISLVDKNLSLDPVLIKALGLKTFGFCLIAFLGRTLSDTSLLVARRSTTALEEPSKLQSLLSDFQVEPWISRERLAQFADQRLNLQPLFYNKLKSVGIFPVVYEIDAGLSWQMVHIYGLDISESPSWRPQNSVTIEYELVPISRFLDAGYAEMVSRTDLYCILHWCITNSMISPETDTNFAHVCELLCFNFPNLSVLYR